MDRELLNSIITEYGSSFYLLDSQQFKNNFLELKESFKKYYDNFNIAYSYKTNYIPKLCKIVDSLGGYAEVVSEMELELALMIGVDYRRIIWNGPVKNETILKQFLLNGGIVNLDSIFEAKYVIELAKTTPSKQFNVGIRCNFDVGDNVVSRFGFDVESYEFKDTLNLINKEKNINLFNLQCHFAKRQIEYWPQRTKGMLNLLDKIGIIPDRIDLGGGLFGKMHEDLKKQFTSKIPYYDEYAQASAKIFADYFNKCDKKPELIIEPGSALVGDCMKFLCEVKTIKNIRGKYFATILGSQKNISMSGVNPPIDILHMSDDGEIYSNLDIVGYTCIEGDIIYKNYSGYLAVGDIVCISNCGSYSIVMKPPFILPNFPILDISEGYIDLIKRGEKFEDIFRTYEI